MIMIWWGNQATKGLTSKTGEKIVNLMSGACGSIFGFKGKLKDIEGNTMMLIDVARDIEAQIAYNELAGTKKRKREVVEWLDELVEICKDVKELKNKTEEDDIISRFRCASSAEKLNKRLKKHDEQRKGFGELVLDHTRGRKEFSISRMYGAGFQRNLDRILDCLAAPNVQIIGIYGADKAGKTTLAKNIHNKVLERTPDHVYWVTISENTTEKMLQDDISRAIGLTLDDKNVEKRATRLNQVLKVKKNFVLILDGLRAYINLETVGYPLHEDGCRLIITTSSSKVCQRVGCQINFEVKMDEEEAWDMFKEANQQDPISPQQERFFKSEVSKNYGFPQRIIKIAKYLEVEESD